MQQISRPETLRKERCLKSTNMYSCEMSFTAANFDSLSKKFFAMKFLEKKLLYVNNIYSKFLGQKINKKKDIKNLPTCVDLRNNCGNHFITSTLTPS